MKVRDLIALLQTANPDAEVAVANVPDSSGWVNEPLGILGSGPDGLVVLGLKEETLFEDEVDVDWPERPL